MPSTEFLKVELSLCGKNAHILKISRKKSKEKYNYFSSSKKRKCFVEVIWYEQCGFFHLGFTLKTEMWKRIGISLV